MNPDLNSLKRFAIIQDDKSRKTWLWNERSGAWLACTEEEFEPLKVLADTLRHHQNPSVVLMTIALEALKSKIDDEAQELE